jgi:hypothetical protein
MATCRGCGAVIAFAETARGKLMPIDIDGTSHFATCPQAERFRRPAPPQDVCLGCGSQDLEHLPGQGPHHGAIKCRECGQHRWLRKQA